MRRTQDTDVFTPAMFQDYDRIFERDDHNHRELHGLDMRGRYRRVWARVGWVLVCFSSLVTGQWMAVDIRTA